VGGVAPANLLAIAREVGQAWRGHRARRDVAFAILVTSWFRLPCGGRAGIQQATGARMCNVVRHILQALAAGVSPPVGLGVRLAGRADFLDARRQIAAPFIPFQFARWQRNASAIEWMSLTLEHVNGDDQREKFIAIMHAYVALQLRLRRKVVSRNAVGEELRKWGARIADAEIQRLMKFPGRTRFPIL
jgi:hypothetical protein